MAVHLDRGRWRLMTLKAYFDGSGTDHDPRTPLLALAGYVGTEEAWKEFEDRWAVFMREEGLDYFHSSEANARVGAFAGKSPGHIALLRAGVTILMRGLNPRDFHGIICTVSMADYRSFEPPMETPAPIICAKYCINTACELVAAAGGPLQIFYDSGERFFPKLHNRWNNKKTRRQDKYLSRISAFTSVDWRDVPAVQAADYLGWCTTSNRACSPLRRAMLTAKLPLATRHYDARRLRQLRDFPDLDV